MTMSPLEAKFVAALDDGRLRLFGGSGEVEVTVDTGASEGGAGNEGTGGEDDEHTKKLKEAEDKAKEAETRAKEAEKKLKDNEKALQDKEREGMEEAEKTALERDEYKEKYDKLLKIVETTFIDQAITNMSGAKDKNGQPKYDWQDATAVRAFLDKEGIEIDIDTGEVKGLEQQVADIAKKRPYLLVSKDDRDGGNSGDYKPPPGGTGNHPFGGQPRQRTTDRNKLGSKYRLPGFAGAASKPM